MKPSQWRPPSDYQVISCFTWVGIKGSIMSSIVSGEFKTMESQDHVSNKIGKVVVSDLGLGRSGPHGSLLHRLTDVRLIGTEK